MFEPRIDASISLTDGRSVGIAEWGAEGGPVVVFLHGSPHSRLWCPDIAATAAAGCRLIAVDRPGYGRSTPPPTISVRGWTDDLVQVLDAMNIGEFSVVGWSGGGMYAAACAEAMPERLRAAGCVAGAIRAPNDDDEPGFADDLSEDSQRVHALAGHDQLAAHLLAIELDADWTAAVQDNPAKILDGPFPPVDRRHFEDPDWAANFYQATREALRQGAWGSTWDWVAGLRPWGFALEDVGIDFYLWHGGQDPVETQAGRDEWADRLPRAHVVSWPDSGHMVVVDHWADILATLLA